MCNIALASQGERIIFAAPDYYPDLLTRRDITLENPFHSADRFPGGGTPSTWEILTLAA